jgi:hypothetical protein
MPLTYLFFCYIGQYLCIDVFCVSVIYILVQCPCTLLSCNIRILTGYDTEWSVIVIWYYGNKKFKEELTTPPKSACFSLFDEPRNNFRLKIIIISDSLLYKISIRM